MILRIWLLLVLLGAQTLPLWGAAPSFRSPGLCSRYIISRILYQPSIAEHHFSTKDMDLPKEFARYTIPDLEFGVEVSGIESVNPESEDPIVVFIYGNAMNIAGILQSNLMLLLQSRERDFCLFDLPGYGDSHGEISERGMVTAARAVVERLAVRYPKKKVILWGWSLGGTIAIQTAAFNYPTVQKLLLTSTWSTFADVAAKHVRVWLPKFLVRFLSRGNDYNSLAAAENLKLETLIIHGAEDWLIPPQMANDLYERIASPSKKLIIVDEEHYIFFEQVRREIGAFFSSKISKSP